MLETDLDDVSGGGSAISKLIGGVDDAAGEDSADGVHENLVELHFLLNKVAVPGANAVVVDGQAL